jgi:hypothetical protein
MRMTVKPNLFTAVVLIIPLVMVACSSGLATPLDTPDTPELTATPADAWSRLLLKTPYPYTTPLPPANATTLDGTYSKLDPREGTRPFCVRCMPYPAEGGIWKLHLDKGIFRILSTRSLNGWNSMGSFAISGNRITLFNDPHCLETVGTYSWSLEGEQLVLQPIQDDCADGWRAITFTNYPWMLNNQ